MTGAQLDQWRLRLGLTKAGAAAALGVTRMSFYNWQAGRTEIPRVVELACWALTAQAVAQGKLQPAPSSSSSDLAEKRIGEGEDEGVGVLAAPFSGPSGPPLD